MFCQKCGAELRLEAGFCAVCGATIPRPTLHLDEDDAASQSRTARMPGQPAAEQHGAPQAAAPRRAAEPLFSPPSTLVPPRPTYQAIRQAAQRGNARGLAPVASLHVSATQPASAPRAAKPQAMPASSPASGPMPGSQGTPTPAMPAQAYPASGQPMFAPAPQPAALAPSQPVSASSQPMLIPVLPPTAMPSSQPGAMPSQPVLMPAQALTVPQAHNGSQPLVNGYHPVGWVVPAATPYASNGAAPIGSVPWQAAGAPGSTRLPADTPNRLALGALICMFASFFLPWVIIGDSRPTPLTVGWPVLVPLAVIAATGLTILVPERTLYARFFLVLPLVLGCFALGSALLVFLLSSAIAVNTVGVGFLGVDIGFALFALGAFVLACAGYHKLIRELPLLLAGRLRLAPLPGALRGLSAPLPPTTYPPAAAQHSSPNAASQNGASSAPALAEES